MNNLLQNFVGVDISKKNLDIFIYPLGESLKINNERKDIRSFIKEIARYNVQQVVCESTGGYEKLFVRLLQKISINCWVVEPQRIKGYITSTGCKAKSDKIDAKKIAEFASKYSPGYEITKKSENEEFLQALVNRKADLTQFLASEKTRLKHIVHQLYVPSINKTISFLEKQIKGLEEKINELIKSNEDLSKKLQILSSIPGIGNATAALLMSHVPELGKLSNNKIAALIGLCPYDRESGNFKGKRFIRGGRLIPRNALYMCALTTIKYHLPLKSFYDRLIANKKSFKVAIVAVMRKLIVLCNILLKKGELCKA